jgi:alpha-L-rhamnosidase
MTRAPERLSIDSGGGTLAISGRTPRLSWEPAGDTDRFEIEAVVDGRRQQPQIVEGHRFVAWPWAPLTSRAEVVWRVGEAGLWSEWSRFEAGLFDEDWTARWISPEETADAGYGRRPAHLLATAFELKGDVVRARLYSTALGVYTAAVNGERAGDVELAPGATSYDKTLHAQAADVTHLLCDGVNRVEIELSDGWFRGQVGAFRIPAAWGTTVAARAELHVDLADRRHLTIATDGSWTSSRSTVIRADLMNGQSTDLTTAVGAPRPVSVDTVDAPPVTWSPAPPVRVVETRAAAEAREVRDGVWVLDFGQNASGRVRLDELGPAGTRTVLEYGEHVDVDGDLSTAHLDSHRPGEPVQVFVQRDEVISAGGEDVFEPRHTVHGFQYVRITRDGQPFDPATARMQVVQSDLRRTGLFACSDKDLNTLHAMADWSFRGNAVDIPTDCPTRERIGWTGDYQVFAPTATRLYDVHGFTRKWLRSVRDDQLDDGRIANFSPDGRQIKHHLDDQFAMMTGSAGWGDAIVAVPWEMYRAYGDEQVLAENWDAMVRWVEWALEKAATTRHHARMQSAPESFEQYLWDGTFHWGEWTEPKPRDADGNRLDPIAHNPMVWFMADKGEVGTAYLFRSVSTLAQIASVLGHEDEARYSDLAGRIRDAWQRAYLRDDGTTATDSQAAYVRALSFDLVPEEMRAAAVDRLVQLIETADHHLSTGFLSTGDLLPVLADNGRADTAYRLLLQRTAPSWLYMVDRGATTIWEDWEGIDDNGEAHDSLNHYSKGAVVRFLHTHTLGLRQARDSIGWRSVDIEPVPGGDLTWARGSHHGPQGVIGVEWRIDGEELVVDVEIPPLTTALIRLPDGTAHRVSRGRHTVSAPVARFAASV